ncbi:hypothetical protein [Streptomyces sparsus]
MTSDQSHVDDPDGDASISDEQWEQFQRDPGVAGRAGAVPKETSARARMVARRLRERDEEFARQQGGRRWGRKKKEPEPWQPEGWRTGPAWQERNGRRPGARAGRALAGLLAFGIVCWGAVHYTDIDASRFGLDFGSEPGEPLPAETAVPSGAPAGEMFPDRPTLDEPFAGSPAERWADGADAIELPKAEAVGDVPRERVAAGLKVFKQFLVASNLDTDVLNGGQPRRAMELVDPLHKELLADMRTALDTPSESDDPTAWFTRFAPDEARTVGGTVKVRGRTEVEEAGPGRATIRADYSFVYAVESVRKPGEVTRTVVRRAMSVDVVDPRQWQSEQDRVWLRDVAINVGNTSCDTYDGFLHPQFAFELMPEDEVTGPPTDPYDRSESVEERAEGVAAGECGALTRV